MNMFLLLYFIYLILGLFIPNMLKINRKIQLILLITPLFILTSFRSIAVGNDTNNYYNAFIHFKRVPFIDYSSSRFEMGYSFLNKIIILLGLDYIHFQIIITLIFFSALYFFLNKYSVNPVISIVVFFAFSLFFQTMNISRQFIAISFLFYSFYSLEKNKKIPFFLSIFFASLFHSTAWIFILVYPFSKFRLNKKSVLLLLVFLFSIYFYFEKITSIFFSYFPKYSSYTETIYYNSEGNIAVYFNLLLYTFIYLTLKIVRYTQNDQEKNKQLDLMESISLLTVIFGVFSLNAPLFIRLNVYFVTFYIISLPYLILMIKKNIYKEITYFSFLVIITSYFLIVTLLRPYWTGVIPYSFFDN